MCIDQNKVSDQQMYAEVANSVVAFLRFLHCIHDILW